MKNKAVYTSDNKIFILDDKGRTREYVASDEVIELNQEFNNFEYLDELSSKYDNDIARTRQNGHIIILASLLNLFIAGGLTAEAASSLIKCASLISTCYLGAVIIGASILIHYNNKKIKTLKRKKDFIDDEKIKSNNKIEELITKVKVKDFESKKEEKIVEFEKVSHDLKNRLDYTLEKTNYDEKTKVYTLKPNK